MAGVAKQTMKTKISRSKFIFSDGMVVRDWGLGGIEIDDDDGEDGDGVDGGQRRSVPADESQPACPVCQDPFDTAWDDEEEAWVYRGALRVRKGEEVEEEEREAKGGKGNKSKVDVSEKVRLKRAAVHEEYDGKILHLNCYQSLLATAAEPIEPAPNGGKDEEGEAEEAIPPLELPA